LIVGILNGLNDPLLLGIQTLLNPNDLYLVKFFNSIIIRSLSSAVSNFLPSTPGVNLPLFVVTFLTARALAENVFTNVSCNL